MAIYYLRDSEWGQPTTHRQKKQIFKTLYSFSIYQLPLKKITPDQNHTWITEGLQSDWSESIPIGLKKIKNNSNPNSIFHLFSLGVSTNRDAWAYNYDPDVLKKNILQFQHNYNSQVKLLESKAKKQIDDAVDYSKIKWSRNLKRHLKRADHFHFDESSIRSCIYRPYVILQIFSI